MATPKKPKKVVRALRDYARSMDDWVRWSRKRSKLRASPANAFLLGVMLDRMVLADQAWDAGEWINDALGDPEDSAAVWKALADIPKPRLRGFLRYGYGGKALHRHYKTFARLLPQAADHILEEYNGDPRRIWNAQRDVEVVRRRFEAIPTLGPALARMAVLILARNYGALGGRAAMRQLDVKPDVHVNRVFWRTGLTRRGASPDDVIQAARSVSREFPAALDAPAWEIGRRWCRPRNPRCKECPIQADCPKVRA